MNLHNNDDSNDDDDGDNDDHNELNGTDFDAALLSELYSAHSLLLSVGWIVIHSIHSFNLFQFSACTGALFFYCSLTRIRYSVLFDDEEGEREKKEGEETCTLNCIGSHNRREQKLNVIMPDALQRESTSVQAAKQTVSGPLSCLVWTTFPSNCCLQLFANMHWQPPTKLCTDDFRFINRIDSKC